jgi:hypothetical protein
VTNKITTPEQEDSRREKKRAPSARKAQEWRALVQGQLAAQRGEE